MVPEARALYDARYLVPPEMRMLSSDGCKMAVNGVSIPPAPTPGTKRWREAI
jgi:hypothetical protein